MKEWGGTTDYSKDAIDAGQYFENLAHFVVAVKCPDDAAEDLQGRFELDLEGELWTLVVPVPRFKGKIVDPDRLQFFADLAAQVSS